MLKQQHLQFGKHSQIPDCCITYFLNEWDNEFDKWGSAQARDPEDVGYVRCPNCIKQKKKNKVHICNYECREFLESIGRTDLAQTFKKPKENDLWISTYQNFYQNSNLVIDESSMNLVRRYWDNHIPNQIVSYQSLVDQIQPMIVYDDLQPSEPPEEPAF